MYKEILKKDKADTIYFNETIKPISEEVLAVLQKHQLNIENSRNVINCVLSKIENLILQIKL